MSRLNKVIMRVTATLPTLYCWVAGAYFGNQQWIFGGIWIGLAIVMFCLGRAQQNNRKFLDKQKGKLDYDIRQLNYVINSKNQFRK